MQIFRMELWRSLRSWVYYTASLIAILVIFLTFFMTFREDAALLDELLQNFPPEFRAAFGFANVDLSQIEGYLSFIFSYLVLIGAVYGMKLGVSLLSEESRRKTADFLLSKPVRRDQVFLAKFSAAMVCVIVQNLLLFAAGLALIPILVRESYDIGIFALLSFSVLLVQMFFIGLGQVIAAAVQTLKQVMPIALGVVFFFFIIELINQSLLEKALTYLTPFSYFKGASILHLHGYDTSYLLSDIVVFLVLTLLAAWLYRRKDIHAT